MREQAIERGVAASLDRRRRCLVVPSRSVTGREYEVRVDGAGGFAKIACNCPAGSSQAPLGSTPCHHGAVGCLAMEAAGLLVWTGRDWLLAAGAPVEVRTVATAVRNPCGGCGQEVDPDCLVPVERAEVRVDGAPWHRRCRFRALAGE